MTALDDKLTQLKLDFMARELDRVVTDAAARSLSPAATLEWLADLELEGRQSRSVERRFRLSKLQAQHGIESFNFNHHKSRQQMKSKLLHLLDLDFVRQGTNIILIGNPGTGKTFLSKIIGWKACQANLRVLFTPAMQMLNQLVASQADHSLVRRLKIYTDPTLLVCDELRLPVPRSADIEPVLPGYLHPPRRTSEHSHYNEHHLLRMGKHSLQHDDCRRHRRPPGGKLRGLSPGRADLAQPQ